MTEKVRFNLGRTIEELGITRNKLAVESKTRPATVLDLVSGETKRIEIHTLVNLLDTLNKIAREQGITRKITISDIIEYIPDNKEVETP
ncbi:helix-turn-helix domain-containing protein [Paenibacillus elgii]|uniref:Control protein n=1 Tax=Paenibacillus elgii TaxID=189691 RepID=A0A163Y3B8_9BACL|nr:helix-turn-helix transcriptional regulator [Paenibacillus elgii]KZE78833.1 control protein [Paenibacillus elgii]NEN84998.1 helix-turn-helix transcriptional regulator [Paenibacillus elgii]